MLDEIDSLVEPELSQVKHIIQNVAQNNAEIITKIILNLISAGGKNIRPKLVILASKTLYHKSDESLLYIASAVELVHNATLLHDDVIDEGKIRRGASTANKIWGSKRSILVGDLLLSQALQHITKAQNLRALEILAKAAGVISRGEITQLECISNIEITINNYMEIITAKTAALFSAACEMAAVITPSTPTQQQSLSNYGLNLGIAFQITDDVLDYAGLENKTGKKIGNDFYNQKITLPVIMALQNANSEEKKFWHKTMQGKYEPNNTDLQIALQYIKNHNAIQKSMVIAKEYADMGEGNLRNIPENKYTQMLSNLLNFTITRAH